MLSSNLLDFFCSCTQNKTAFDLCMIWRIQAEWRSSGATQRKDIRLSAEAQAANRTESTPQHLRAWRTCMRALFNSSDCCVPASTRSLLESCMLRSLMYRPVLNIALRLSILEKTSDNGIPNPTQKVVETLFSHSGVTDVS